jgi:glycosyltransferase involved in cell wall biosynthesis
VIDNGIYDCFFAAGAAPPPADPNRLLVVGGLNDWEGAAHILAVADLLARDLPEITIDIAGALDEPRYVAAAASRPNIRHLGYLPGDLLAATMPGYLALPYLLNVKSFGLAAVEAMATSLPAIARTSTAVHEIAGDAALSVGAHSPPAIVAAIRELCDSPASRAA